MQRLLSKVLAVLITAAFAALVISPAVAADQGGTTVTKEYCKSHPTDPRCKDMQ
ncbi:MAG TPA: hypothetical protein VKP89_12635 [Burkholderiales bacterium]|nr:hypothetical protein [Burkholderiales bacterium]